MKALKEIGREMWDCGEVNGSHETSTVFTARDPRNSDCSFWVEDDLNVGDAKRCHVYTDDDRREFARAVIRKWEAYKWHSLEREAATRQTYSIEEFFKNEGL